MALPASASSTSAVGSQVQEEPRRFTSLLFEDGGPQMTEARQDDRSWATDLNLDQVVGSIVANQEEPEFLSGLLYSQLHDPESVRFRQEVFRDLEDGATSACLRRFTSLLGEVRAHLRQMEKMRHAYQQEAWTLDAAALYCQAVQALADDLGSVHLGSRGLRAFRDYLDTYAGSPAFATLSADTRERKEALAGIRYCTRIRGGRVDVTRYEGQADYSAEVLKTFERFQQGAVKDYRVNYRTWPGMNHVGGWILDRVARLFPEEFSDLDQYCRRHTGFLDETVRCFDRELQFYLAYLDYIEPLRSSRLSFCIPQVSAHSKAVSATETFDLALARKLISERRPVVTNDFTLDGLERIFVVSGPNQGGKTTFARTFGQLHHLASIGCPVPGREARLFLFDRLFTHFAREEDLARMSGKLEDDIARVGEILGRATQRSIIILNEVFTSTTLQDATFLGTKLMTKMIRLDLLGVYVTFVDELASLAGSVVSMVSTVVPHNPAERTYKVVRGPANGLAYALAIAEKHDVTYERLRHRLGQGAAS